MRTQTLPAAVRSSLRTQAVQQSLLPLGKSSECCSGTGLAPKVVSWHRAPAAQLRTTATSLPGQNSANISCCPEDMKRRKVVGSKAVQTKLDGGAAEAESKPLAQRTSAKRQIDDIFSKRRPVRQVWTTPNRSSCFAQYLRGRHSTTILCWKDIMRCMEAATTIHLVCNAGTRDACKEPCKAAPGQQGRHLWHSAVHCSPVRL